MRSCEGSLKKRGHCLIVNGSDARALIAPASISGRLSIRRVPTDQVTTQTQPRAVLRVANRGSVRETPRPPVTQNLEPFLQDIQNDVARLSRAFVRLGREANALALVELQSRNYINSRNNLLVGEPVVRPVPPPPTRPVALPPVPAPVAPLPHIQENEQVHLSRNARRRMRLRVRAALNASQSPQERPTSASTASAQHAVPNQRANIVGAAPRSVTSAPQRPNAPSVQRAAPAATTQRQNGPTSTTASIPTFSSGLAIVQPATPPAQPSSGPSNGRPNNENQTRANKKKRRHRR